MRCLGCGVDALQCIYFGQIKYFTPLNCQVYSSSIEDKCGLKRLSLESGLEVDAHKSIDTDVEIPLLHPVYTLYKHVTPSTPDPYIV